MKKRILAVLLSAIMILTLGACGNSNNNDTEKNNGKDVQQPSITKLADYKDFAAILVGDYEVTDEKVKTYFSNVVYEAGIGLTEVKDRNTVQAGDIVKTDYTGYLDGKAFSGGSTISADGKSNPAWIDVSENCGIDPTSGAASGYFIEGFSAGLIGAKIGQKTSSDVTFPADYSNKELAGKLTTFEFDVKGIYVETTPENITDAVVKATFGESYKVSTVAEFMQVMKEELAYNMIVNHVIEKSTFNIPEDYLNYRLEGYQSLFEDLYCGSTDIDTFLAMYGTTLATMKAQWASSLQSQIKAELVFAAIVKDAGLKVDEKELADYVAAVQKTANSEGGNSYFKTEENIYKMIGVGSVEAGKTYFLNQDATRDYVMENYQ